MIFARQTLRTRHTCMSLLVFLLWGLNSYTHCLFFLAHIRFYFYKCMCRFGHMCLQFRFVMLQCGTNRCSGVVVRACASQSGVAGSILRHRHITLGKMEVIFSLDTQKKKDETKRAWVGVGKLGVVFVLSRARK